MRKTISECRELEFEYAVSFAKQSLTDTFVQGEAYRTGTITKQFEANEKARTFPAAKAFVQVDAKIR